MSATALTVQPVPETGLEIVYTAPTQNGGHTAPCGGGTALLVRNGTGSPITVTLTTPGTFDGLAIADQTVTVTNAKDELIPLPSDLYADTSTGKATFALSANDPTILVACVRVS